MNSGSVLDEMTSRVAEFVLGVPKSGRRRIVAIAGAPGSGKSTLSKRVAETLGRSGSTACVLPMDGFHLDNRILDDRNLRSRKGAPQTFDLGGLKSILERLSIEDEVIAPSFDRSIDMVIGSSIVIGPDVETVLVEGNYLLLDRPGWRDLIDLWDATVLLKVNRDELRDRLIQRWLDEGFGSEMAMAKTMENDLPNADLVYSNALPADLVL